MKTYSYPLDASWSREELALVIQFLNRVEDAYESSVAVEAVLTSYAAFKTVVKTKLQEKQIDREFEKNSGYSSYQVIKAAKAKERGYLSLER